MKKIKFEFIDLLDKLIEPSKEMEKFLKSEFGLTFFDENKSTWSKYDFMFWMVNEDEKTYSPKIMNDIEYDAFNELIFMDYDILKNKKDVDVIYFMNIRERFIPDRMKTQQNILLDFFKFKLIDNNGSFRFFGPNSIIHDKTDDKILVYVRTDTIHIIHDGKFVINNFSIEYFSFNILEVSETTLDPYLQTILNHF